MRALDRCEEVRGLATAMGVSGAGGLVAGLLAHCRSRVGGWVVEAGGVGSIDDVERVVCNRLGLVIEEAWTDADIGEICGRYVSQGEPVFGCLWTQFDASTYAVLIRCRRSVEAGLVRYVAVIDCRGEKRHRRFFSRWHEIAHMLMLPPSMESPVHRSGDGRSAVERLMDMIAADIGFFAPVFAPVLEAEVRSAGGLSFAGVERVRRGYCPRASYEATLHACVDRLGKAAMILEVGFGGDAGGMGCFPAGVNMRDGLRNELRVLKSVSNAEARSIGLMVRRNCRVPDKSVLTKFFFDAEEWGGAGECELVEQAALWSGAGLTWPGDRLRIAMTMRHGRVLAMVFPAEDEDI
ncbi:MAG: hypothetical protein GX456_09475 [Verrucomicrobia bacterium]|nr:hypothetical protein [Verrucomicrobiota bacterium]